MGQEDGDPRAVLRGLAFKLLPRLFSFLAFPLDLGAFPQHSDSVCSGGVIQASCVSELAMHHSFSNFILPVIRKCMPARKVAASLCFAFLFQLHIYPVMIFLLCRLMMLSLKVLVSPPLDILGRVLKCCPKTVPFLSRKGMFEKACFYFKCWVCYLFISFLWEDFHQGEKCYVIKMGR